MKQKTDEFPDQWVRQTLSQLPDAPPPGSSFDPERLWRQLRPELEQAPTRWLAGWMWWVVAACLTGLVLGWFWLYQSTSDPIDMATHGIKRKVEVPVISHRTPDLSNEIAQSKSVVGEKGKFVSRARMHGRQKERLEVESTPQVTEPTEVIQTPEVLTIAEISPVVEKRLELAKPNIVISAPKRRFKVVHENELRAEEETRPKLYPTQNFVRVGTGRYSEPIYEESLPALTIPLIHKPNQ